MSVSRAGNDSTSPPGPAAHVRDDDYDALAELFLGEAAGKQPLRLSRHDDHDENRVEPSPSQGHAAVEALVLGHLPVLSGPWVAQYARFLADSSGQSIALLRVYGDQASIDLFGNADAGGVNPSASLESALGRLGPIADRWIIRVDPTSEPLLATSKGVHRVTLLCGADDAAVVSAYQTIKRLHTDEDDGPPMQEVSASKESRYRVVIIGAAPDRARAASEKIRRAASAFLSLNVRVEPGPTQVGPTRGLTVYRGLAPEDLDRFVATVTDPQRQPQKTFAHAAHVKPAAQSPDLSHDEPATQVAWPGPNPADPVPAAGSGPLQTHESLASHLTGLTVLDVQCPYSTDVELATDGSGRLQLLTWLGTDACQRLEVVSAWARDHAPLLVRLAPGGFDATNPMRHVFTETPIGARRLLDSGVCVHLLAPVTIEGRRGWFCTPLNAPGAGR